MTSKIIARAGQARCYECGATGVAQVCHHCGVAICAEHAHLPNELYRWLLRHEFAGMPLPNALRKALPAHCNNCAHSLGEPNGYVVAAGVVLALLGGLLALASPSPAAALLVLLGLAVVLWAAVQQWRRHLSGQGQLKMPLLPRISVLKMRETVEAAVTLTVNGDYQPSPISTTGSIELLGRLQGSERARLEAYRKRFALPAAQAVPYHAGFLVLRGAAGLRLTGAGQAAQPSINIIALTGDTSTLALLNGSSARESEPFAAPYSYQVCEPLKPMPLPINLVPSLFQEGDQHALALDLQWNAPRQWNEKPLEIERILLLRLDVPATWGDIEHASSNVVCTNLGNGYCRFEWAQLELDPEHSNWKRNCRRFSLRFKNRIDCSDTILARAEVQFQGTLSGLSGADLFSPLGTLYQEKLGKPVTVVVTDFTLSLAHVRYQNIRTVPDFKHLEDQQNGRKSVYVYPDIVPNHATVSALTEALSRHSGLYLKRIIENPPRVGEHASQRNLYWDIAGRQYSSVYPIDVHIVLSGEEHYRGRARIPSHATHVALTVQGAYANPQMEAQIVKLWHELRTIIDRTLGAHSQAPYAAAASMHMGSTPAAQATANGNGAAGNQTANGSTPAAQATANGNGAAATNGAAHGNGAAGAHPASDSIYQQLHELIELWHRGNHTQPIHAQLSQLLHETGINPDEGPLQAKEVGGGVR